MIDWLEKFLFGPSKADAAAWEAYCKKTKLELETFDKKMDRLDFERDAMLYAAEALIESARKGQSFVVCRPYGKWHLHAVYQTLEDDPSDDPEPVGLAGRKTPLPCKRKDIS